MVAIEHATKKGACMKNRVWRPRAVLAAFAVIAVTLTLSTGVASASTAKPASSSSASVPTVVTKIYHTKKCTRATLSVRYDDGKKVACYTGQGFLQVALPAATGATAGLSGGFLFLREGVTRRVVPFFPHEPLRLLGHPEVTGIALSSLRVVSPKVDSGNPSTIAPDTVGFTVDVSGGNVTLTAASRIDAALINFAVTAGFRPDGGSCHSYGWKIWLDNCEWVFSHAVSEEIINKARDGGRAAVAAVCTGVLHKILGTVAAAAVCTFFAGFFNFLKNVKLGKDQCIAVRFYFVPPHGWVAIQKC
jgi:hypothetical protein